MKKTIYIDTENSDVIFKNMTPNNRNMVRKAKKTEFLLLQIRENDWKHSLKYMKQQ